MSELIKLTGLWKSKTKNGVSLLSGSLNAVTSLLIMPNTFKKSEKDPDYYVYVKANDKKPAADRPQAPKDELDF